MVSWKLWRALHRPPAPSPLYRRAYVRQYPTPERPLQIRIPLLSLMSGLFKNASLIVLPVLLILLGAPILVLLYYLALLLAPLLVPLANTIYGLIHAMSASGGIAKERDQQTYDVICTAPAGILGMHWSYCTGWLHYHATYRYALLGVLSIGIVASVFGLASQVVFGADRAPLVTMIVRGLALGTLFVVDYAQTTVISSLTVLLIPAHAENESNARLWASSLFLGLQLSVYLPTLLIGVVALPNTLLLLGVDASTSAIITPLLYVTFFVVLREVIIIGLWRRVEAELSATRVELDAITRVAV